LELRSVDPVTAEVATTLASGYRLRAADAVHLATAGKYSEFPSVGGQPDARRPRSTAVEA
jgi:predicted nucleic acid-binding protein